MQLIVGLGNPGKAYERTRHNVGFRALDLLAQQSGAATWRVKFKGLYLEGRLPRSYEDPAGAPGGDGRLLLVKPQTFMNCSGETVVGFMGFFKIPLERLLVVVDDVALPLGRIRLRRAGSAGGHNGLKDIQDRLGSQEYARLRIGVGGRDAQAGPEVAPDLREHVLGRFSKAEEGRVEESLKQAVEACLVWAGMGVAFAMNRYNA